MNEQRIFLSYSQEDQSLVESVRRELQKKSEFRFDDPANWAVADYDLRPKIRDLIRKSDEVVVVCSDRAAQSPWVNYEVGMAPALGVPIRVFLAKGTRSELPAGLERREFTTITPVQESLPSPHREA